MPCFWYGKGRSVIACQGIWTIILRFTESISLPTTRYGDLSPGAICCWHLLVVGDAFHYLQLPLTVQTHLHLGVCHGQNTVKGIPDLRLDTCSQQRKGYHTYEPFHHHSLVFVPMLEESDRLLDGLAFLLIGGTAGSVGQAGCFTQILVAVVQALELWPLTDNDVHAHSITGNLVLSDDDGTSPVAVEWLLHPLGVWCPVHVARTVGAINEEEQSLLPHVLVCHPVYEGLIARLAVTLILAHVVVCVSSPEQVDVCSSIPVLGCQRHSWT